MNPERLVYCLMNRSWSLYSYAKNILEDIGYKGYNIKIFFLLILTILISTPFDSDFKIPFQLFLCFSSRFVATTT